MVGLEAVLLAARPWCSSGNNRNNDFVVILTAYKEKKFMAKGRKVEGTVSLDRLVSSFGILHSVTIEWDHLSGRSSCRSTQLQEGHTWGFGLSHQICSKLNWAILGFIIELWN